MFRDIVFSPVVILQSQAAMRVASFGVRQLAAALAPIGCSHRDDESGSKLPHLKTHR
jgi:hypothetical protein